MSKTISRREFLKLPGISMGSLVLSSFFPRDQEETLASREIGRITTTQISVHSQPRDDARIVRQRYRDELITIYKQLTPPTGPAWNPLWYRVWSGYIHSAYVQIVNINHSPIETEVNPGGILSEVTVPFTQAFRFSKTIGWEPLYRLYYETVHWVMGVDEGPDKSPWYKLKDELLKIEYYVPAHHIRLIPAKELEPISPQSNFEDKRIEVNLAKQTLTAYEKDEVVLHSKISSGIKTAVSTNGIPTQTPKGKFNISVKMPSKHMGEGRLTDNLEDYELLGVPWTAFFHPDGYAIHGTYWHNNFGVPMSRGCINMTTREAKWLFRWMTPVNAPSDIDRRGYGTQLIIT